jgi:5-methylthioadenosine/S-adenosylhomocysteine deaminase
MKIIIRSATVIPMTVGSPVLPETDIYIEGDTIVGIGQTGRSFPATEAERVINGRGKIALPGFINAHTHTPMTILRGVNDGRGSPRADDWIPPERDWTAHLTPEDHYWSSFLAIAEMIRSGTTTFVDMYRDMDRVGQAVIDSGIRAALGWEILTFINDETRWLAYDEATAKRTFEESARFAADWNGRADGRITTLIAPHETFTCREPWLSRAARLAEELGLGITMHLAEWQTEIDYCRERYGKTPVEVVRDAGILDRHVIAAHCLFLSESDMDVLGGRSFHAVACPQSHLKLGTRTTPVPGLLARGINVALGTDSAATNNNLDMIEEMRLAVFVHAFLTGNAAAIPGDTSLRLMTVNGARALNREHDLGTLEVGKKADIVLLDTSGPHMHPFNNILSNIIYSAGAGDVQTVLVDGRILMEDRRIVAFDEAEVIRQADRCVARRRAEVAEGKWARAQALS